MMREMASPLLWAMYDRMRPRFLLTRFDQPWIDKGIAQSTQISHIIDAIEVVQS